MRRYLRGFLALKAVVAGLAILALWGRSYYVGDLVRRGTDTQWIELGSAFGSTIITFGHDGKPTQLSGSSWHYVASKDPRQMLRDVWLTDESVWNRLGFGFNRDVYFIPTRGMIFNIVLPHWLIFLLAIPSAVKWVWRRNPAGVFADDSPAVDEAQLECPTCGQLLWKRVPTACPRCGQPLIATGEFI